MLRNPGRRSESFLPLAAAALAALSVFFAFKDAGHLAILAPAGRKGADGGDPSARREEGDLRRGLSVVPSLSFRDPRTVDVRRGADDLPPAPREWEWYPPLIEYHARAWPSRADDHSWCGKRHPRHGLFYIKTPKTGSSAAAAVTRQTVRNVAMRENPGIGACQSWSMHNFKRDPAKSVMWTTVRRPDRQVMSHYFFGAVSRKGEEPWSGDWRGQFDRMKNFQTKYLGEFHPGGIGSLRKTTLHSMYSGPTEIREVIQDVMDHYDFFAVTERMDESLVVFKLLFGLEDEDIVNLGQNKHAGGFDDGRTKKGCRRISESYATPEAEEYLGGDFRVGNHDFFLYDVAARSLNMTIDALGRERVAEGVTRLKMLQDLVQGECMASTVFPCTKEGPPNPEAKNHCYSGDMGCGHECVQQALLRYREGTLVSAPDGGLA